MARETSLLTSATPTHIAPAAVTIGHVQLRDVLICPRTRGVVNYVRNQSIVEHNIITPGSAPRILADLNFVPNALASMQVPGTDNMLVAAGGQEAEIHLSLHGPPSPSSPSSSSDEDSHTRSHRCNSNALWQFEAPLPGSINNSVLLTSMNLTRSNESGIEPRVGISNNDLTVKFYDVPVRGETPPNEIKQAGMLRLDVPVNHSSLSPDGRTLLSVGDSPQVYLHRLSGGSRITFTPITTLSLPPLDALSLSSSLSYSSSSSIAASFSTAFSSNGTKFAVASQEGAVVIWDVRSSKPLKVFQTDKTRFPGGGKGPTTSDSGVASGWLSDDPWNWSRGAYRAPGWGVRSVKFGSDDSGREVMTFTEHTSLLHIIDARTFEMEEIVRMPSCAGLHPPPPPALSPIASPRVRSTSRLSSPVHSSSPSPPPLPPTATPRIVRDLEDTFRIPGSGSGSNDAHLSYARWRASRSSDDGMGGDEGIAVLPPLGDVVVENAVRHLIGRHGIHYRSRTRDSEMGYEAEVVYDAAAEDEHERQRERERERQRENIDTESMEIDELESDCISSHTPSRSSSPSPSPSTHIPLQVTASPFRVAPRYLQGQGRRHRRRTPLHRKEDLDLAGMCFDPSGGFVYVASVDGVAEWSVRGAEKRWWFESRWA